MLLEDIPVIVQITCQWHHCSQDICYLEQENQNRSLSLDANCRRLPYTFEGGLPV